MNICFLFGTINSDIKFDFLINHKKHISIASCIILIDDGCEIEIFAFDTIADMLYSSYNVGAFIRIEGTIINNCIEVIKIYEC